MLAVLLLLFISLERFRGSSEVVLPHAFECQVSTTKEVDGSEIVYDELRRRRTRSCVRQKMGRPGVVVFIVVVLPVLGFVLLCELF